MDDDHRHMENEQFPFIESSQSRAFRSSVGVSVLCVGSDGDLSMAPRTQLKKSPGFSLSVILRGRGSLRDADGRIYPVEPGSIVERWPGQYQDLQFDTSERYAKAYIHLDKKAYRGLCALGLCEQVTPVYRVHEPMYVKKIMCTLFEDLRVRSDWDAMQVVEALMPLLRLVKEQRIDSDIPQRDLDVLAEAARLLSRDVKGQLSMEGLADRCGLNYHSFRRQFKQRYQMSPARYRQEARMARACEMLGHQQVQEVAEELGFCNAFEFSARFRSIMGVAPSAYANVV